MKKASPLVAVVTLAAYSFAAFGCSSTPRSPTPPSITKSVSELNSDFSINNLNTYSIAELSDRSTALFIAGRYADGLKVARHGVSVAKTAKERAAFRALATQQLAGMGKNEEAGQEALLGAHDDPDNRLLTLYRIQYFDSAGNKLQAAAARDRLKELDPAFNSKPVIEPITVGTAFLILQYAAVLMDGIANIYIAYLNKDAESQHVARINSAESAQSFITPILGSVVKLAELSKTKTR